MKSFETLPEGYHEIYAVNLQKEKKLVFLINFISCVIAIIMLVIPWVFVSNPFEMHPLVWLSILVLTVIYMILHELVHGIAMKTTGTKKVKYGFTGPYAFAGSKDYYDKKTYITIALAPVVVFGLILAIIQIFTPINYFWIPWFVQIANISGAAGDAYVTWKFSKMPKDILITDYGVGMVVYSKDNSLHKAHDINS